jgi:hypothetical protein
MSCRTSRPRFLVSLFTSDISHGGRVLPPTAVYDGVELGGKWGTREEIQALKPWS